MFPSRLCGIACQRNVKEQSQRDSVRFHCFTRQKFTVPLNFYLINSLFNCKMYSSLRVFFFLLLQKISDCLL